MPRFGAIVRVFAGSEASFRWIVGDVGLNAAKGGFVADDMIEAFGLPELAVSSEMTLNGSGTESFPRETGLLNVFAVIQGD